MGVDAAEGVVIVSVPFIVYIRDYEYADTHLPAVTMHTTVYCQLNVDDSTHIKRGISGMYGRFEPATAQVSNAVKHTHTRPMSRYPRGGCWFGARSVLEGHTGW